MKTSTALIDKELIKLALHLRGYHQYSLLHEPFLRQKVEPNRLIYETKGLTLEEIDELYSTKVVPWKSAGWVPPSDEEMVRAKGYTGDIHADEEQV